MQTHTIKNQKCSGGTNVKPHTVLLLLALSVALCAAVCFILWSAEMSNPLPALPALSGVMNPGP
jgi:hypothetical protein